MEKRITTLEVIADQSIKSMDRLDRSITDLRADVDRKFIWIISSQFATLLAVIGLLSKMSNIF